MSELFAIASLSFSTIKQPLACDLSANLLRFPTHLLQRAHQLRS